MNRSLPNTILMTADTVGGVWTYALELCRSLEEFDIQVHLATMGKQLSSSQWEATESIPNLEIQESEFALEWMDNPWQEVDKAGQWLIELEQEIQPDLVHLNNYAHGNLPWNAPVLMVGHSCVLSWWQAVKGEEAPDEWNIYEKRVKEGLQQSDYVVGVSCYMLDRLNELYGPLSDVDFIYNARDAGNFNSADKEELIFSMGRLWDEAKNIRSLSEISGQLSWPVYVAGAGREQSNSENITFLDQIAPEKVAEWLGRTSIYVMPARYEPFGLSVLEAALSGCALVLGDIPTLREIWGSAALYADPGNPHELRHRIKSLIENPFRRKQMAQKAEKRARFYSPDRFAEQYLDVYKKLMWTGQDKPEKKKENAMDRKQI